MSMYIYVCIMYARTLPATPKKQQRQEADGLRVPPAITKVPRALGEDGTCN